MGKNTFKWGKKMALDADEENEIEEHTSRLRKPTSHTEKNWEYTREVGVTEWGRGMEGHDRQLGHFKPFLKNLSTPMISGLGRRLG